MGHMTRFDPYRFLDDTHTSPMSWRFFRGMALTPSSTSTRPMTRSR